MNKTIKFITLGLAFLCITTLGVTGVFSADWFGNSTSDPYLCQGGGCGIEEGAEAARTVIDDIEPDKPLSVYILDVVKYLLTFLALIAVIIVIYAGFMILVSGGDEEKVKTSRKMIIYALIGIVIIFLAVPIVYWLEEALNGTVV